MSTVSWVDDDLADGGVVGRQPQPQLGVTDDDVLSRLADKQMPHGRRAVELKIQVSLVIECGDTVG